MDYIKKLRKAEDFQFMALLSVVSFGFLVVVCLLALLTGASTVIPLLFVGVALVLSIVSVCLAEIHCRKYLQVMMWEMGFCAEEHSEGGVRIFGLNISSAVAAAGLKTDDWMFWLDRKWLGGGINSLYRELPYIYERFLQGERIVFGVVRQLDDYKWVHGGFAKS